MPASAQPSPRKQQAAVPQLDRVYELAAGLFALMSTPIRLKIISALCHGEKTVGELLAEIDTTQPNMSQHLSHLQRAGVLARRRAGQQMIYSIDNERAALLCRAVCTQIAIEIDDPQAVAAGDNLLPRRA